MQAWGNLRPLKDREALCSTWPVRLQILGIGQCRSGRGENLTALSMHILSGAINVYKFQRTAGIFSEMVEAPNVVEQWHSST